MAGRRLNLILLLVLLVMWLALASEESRYEKFIRQHIDFPKTNASSERDYCNYLMRNRSMSQPPCKMNNTFINANIAIITRVCSDRGTPGRGNLRDSKDPFHLVTCQFSGTLQKKKCDYRGYSSYQHIRIGCEGGLPVHYEQPL